MFERSLINNHRTLALRCLSHRILVQWGRKLEISCTLICAYPNCAIFHMQYMPGHFPSTNAKEPYLLWSLTITSIELTAVVSNKQLCPRFSCLSAILIHLQNTQFCYLKTFMEIKKKLILSKQYRGR